MQCRIVPKGDGKVVLMFSQASGKGKKVTTSAPIDVGDIKQECDKMVRELRGEPSLGS